MGKKQRPISRPTPTSSPLPNKVNNAEQDGTDVYHVQPISKTPSISSHEPISSDSNPNSKSRKRPNGSKIDGSLSPKRTKSEGSNAAAVVPSKSRFNRFWSYDDEITILKGMIDFISEKGSDPNKSIIEFLSFIKNSLRVEASTTQLREKIRKLRMKFEKNGESPSFSSSHDSDLFELSKKIWGNAVAGITNKSLEKPESDGNKEGENVKVVDFEKDAEIENVKVVDFEKDAEIENVKVVDSEKDAEIENDDEKNETMSYLTKALELSGLGNDFIKKGIELLGESKRMEMEKLWKEVEITEFELSVRRVELVAKQNRLIVEALKSSNH